MHSLSSWQIYLFGKEEERKKKETPGSSTYELRVKLIQAQKEHEAMMTGKNRQNSY